MWYDRIRRVTLGNAIELEVTENRAELLIGPADRDADKQWVVFSRPAVVSALAIVAQVIEEQGQVKATESPATEFRTRWIECPACGGRGGGEDDDGN
jgi:hypothetical protein